MSAEAPLSKKYKEQGNSLFKEGKWKSALEYYTKALDALTINANPDKKEIASLYANRCLAHLKLGIPKEALRDAEDCLRNDESNLKGHYLQCTSLIGVQKYIEAYNSIKHASEKVDPNNQDYKMKLAEVTRILQFQKEGSKQLMFYSLQDFGDVHSWGENKYGELGLGSEKQRQIPLRLETFAQMQVRKVSCGFSHGAAVCGNGTIWTWGSGKYGKLGLGDLSDQGAAKMVQALKGTFMIDVSCGHHSTFAIAANGEAYSWGRGDSGQLGHGDKLHLDLPKKIASLKTGKHVPLQISCGRNHVATITEAGVVLVWGQNEYGQLGLGHDKERLVPVVLEAFKNRKIAQIECGREYSIALEDLGEQGTQVLTWGRADWGVLGHGERINKSTPTAISYFEGWETGDFVIQVAAGSSHAGAVTNRGYLYLWGRNAEGQLGTGDTLEHDKPAKVIKLSPLAENSVPLNDPAWRTEEDRPVSYVSCGVKHTTAVTRQGEVWTVGKGDIYMFGRPGNFCLFRMQEGLDLDDGIHAARVSCGKRQTLILESKAKKAWKPKYQFQTEKAQEQKEEQTKKEGPSKPTETTNAITLKPTTTTSEKKGKPIDYKKWESFNPSEDSMYEEPKVMEPFKVVGVYPTKY